MIIRFFLSPISTVFHDEISSNDNFMSRVATPSTTPFISAAAAGKSAPALSSAIYMLNCEFRFFLPSSAAITSAAPAYRFSFCSYVHFLIIFASPYDISPSYIAAACS